MLYNINLHEFLSQILQFDWLLQELISSDRNLWRYTNENPSFNQIDQS